MVIILADVINFSGSKDISAFIAEPVVAGSTRATGPPPEYFKIIRWICDKCDILFIADAVFSGNGRTGKFYAIEHWNVVPDIIATAKGVASGYVPLGATIILFDSLLTFQFISVKLAHKGRASIWGKVRRRRQTGKKLG
jgi:adenosylmethionine-8-amino-7-oxononanoate aminotransferase